VIILLLFEVIKMTKTLNHYVYGRKRVVVVDHLSERRYVQRFHLNEFYDKLCFSFDISRGGPEIL